MLGLWAGWHRDTHGVSWPAAQCGAHQAGVCSAIREPEWRRDRKTPRYRQGSRPAGVRAVLTRIVAAVGSSTASGTATCSSNSGRSSRETVRRRPGIVVGMARSVGRQCRR